MFIAFNFYLLGPCIVAGHNSVTDNIITFSMNRNWYYTKESSFISVCPGSQAHQSSRSCLVWKYLSINNKHIQCLPLRILGTAFRHSQIYPDFMSTVIMKMPLDLSLSLSSLSAGAGWDWERLKWDWNWKQRRKERVFIPVLLYRDIISALNI